MAKYKYRYFIWTITPKAQIILQQYLTDKDVIEVSGYFYDDDEKSEIFVYEITFSEAGIFSELARIDNLNVKFFKSPAGENLDLKPYNPKKKEWKECEKLKKI